LIKTTERKICLVEAAGNQHQERIDEIFAEEICLQAWHCALPVLVRFNRRDSTVPDWMQQSMLALGAVRVGKTWKTWQRQSWELQKDRLRTMERKKTKESCSTFGFKDYLFDA